MFNIGIHHATKIVTLIYLFKLSKFLIKFLKLLSLEVKSYCIILC